MPIAPNTRNAHCGLTRSNAYPLTLAPTPDPHPNPLPLSSFTRINALFAANFFKSVLYHPDESQLLTCGTDRKLTYWDVTDMNAIRIVDGSESAEINTLDISHDGHFFVSGGADKKVKLWHYDEGSQYFEGSGHSGSIVMAKVSPDEQRVVTVGSEGGIFLWKVPDIFANAERH